MEQFRAEYAQLRASWGGDPARYRSYDRWVATANNAMFGTQATYDELVPGFEALFRREGGDWERFYAAAKDLAKLPKPERHARLKEYAGG
jgi:predicted aminopeptidase